MSDDAEKIIVLLRAVARMGGTATIPIGVPGAEKLLAHIDTLATALAAAQESLTRWQQIHDALIDALEGKPTTDEHTLVKAVKQLAALPPTWTTERPRVPGWYWWRDDEADSDPAIVQVFRDDDGLYAAFNNSDEKLDRLDCEWSGPLTPPGGVK